MEPPCPMDCVVHVFDSASTKLYLDCEGLSDVNLEPW